jgi:hypothetical protein
MRYNNNKTKLHHHCQVISDCSMFYHLALDNTVYVNLLMRKTTPVGGIPKKSDELSNNDRFFIRCVTSFKSSSFLYLKRCNKATFTLPSIFLVSLHNSKPFIFAEACLILNTLLEMNLSYYLGIIIWLFQLFHIGQHTQLMLLCFYYDPIRSI